MPGMLSMAKKKQGFGPVALGLVFLLGLLSQVPKSVWMGFGFLVLIGVLIYWLTRSSKSGVNSPEPVPEVTRTRSDPVRQQVAVSAIQSHGAKAIRASDDDIPVPITLRSASTATFSVPPSPKWSGPTRWIAPNEVVSVAGITFSGGMVYVGNSLASPAGGPDPTLIDPSKAVNLAGKYTERSMGYWPSYSDIDPKSRGAYLNWLASGRKDPVADIGYVFIFFYGLERRVILDWSSDPAATSERPLIIRELQRLLTIYGANHSFRNYAKALLEWVNMAEHPLKLYEEAVPELERGWELPPYMRVALGLASAARAPIPAHLALAWVRLEPTYSLRTPATRCPEIFEKSFFAKYREVFEDGLVLQKNRTKLKFQYQAASAGFRGVVPNLNFGDIPDVTALTAPVKKISEVAESATKELDSYSRYLAKNPESTHALEALILLPFWLWPTESQEKVTALKERVIAEPIALPFKELMASLGGVSILTKEKVLGLATVLESFDMGMEPDVLSGSKVPKPDDTVVLFTSSSCAPSARATPEYQAALLTLQVASAVAAADGTFSEVELAHLRTQVFSWKHLSEAQVSRLLAHLRLLVAEPASLPALKKKIEPLDAAGKESIASYMAAVAQSDGNVSPDELKILEKVYKALGVEPKQVFSDVHAAAAGQLVPKSGTSSSSSGIQLDPARIAALQKDTERVSALLAGIFKDDEPAAMPPAQVVHEDSDEDETPSGEVALLGLDESHAAFARVLMSRPSWAREELLDVAADLDLMLDGALERINEASFDVHDAPFTEGDDPVEVNSEVLEKIAA